MSVLVSHTGTYKEATGMWCSLGGQWLEISTGGGEPPKAAAVAKLTVQPDLTLKLDWANGVIVIPVPAAYEILLGSTTSPDVLPTDWLVVHTEPFVPGALARYSWTGPDPVSPPDAFTYGMVLAVGVDDSRSSPTYTNPVLHDPLPTAPLNLVGVWASLEHNELTWSQPAEPGSLVEYVICYSSTGPIVNPGEGAEIGVVPRGVEFFNHTKAAGEQDVTLWYSVFGRRTDGLLGAQSTVMIEKGVTPAPRTFSAVGTSPSQISLSWLAPDYLGDATGYRLLVRSDSYPVGPTDPNAQVLLDNAPFTTVSYSHTGLPAETTRYYLICCNQPGGYGESAIDQGTTQRVPPPVPGAPSSYGVYPGVLWCWFWADWYTPTNTSEISSYEMRCQANSAPGAGGTHVRNVLPGSSSVGYYLRFVYETFVTSQTMGVSTNAENISGEGPWASGVATLGGFANSMCLGMRDTKPGIYDPTPGLIEDLDPHWVEFYQRAVKRQAPHDINEAWNNVSWLLDNNGAVDDDTWWCRVMLALETALYMDKPSQEGWDRANGVWLSPRERSILDYWHTHLQRAVNERNSDTGVLALTECMSALGTSW